MTYVAGFNVPGFLPSGEPQEFESLEDAKSFLVDEIENYIDCMVDFNEDTEEPELRLSQFKDMEPRVGMTVYVGDYAFWMVEKTS